MTKFAAAVNRVYFGTRAFGVAVADGCLTNLTLTRCPGRLLVTSDGGVRWTTVLSRPAPVFAAVSHDKQLWAAEIVPGVTTSPAIDIRFSISTNGGRTWRSLGNVTGLEPLTPEAELTLATRPEAGRSARLA
jgi:hypothetical protein